MEIGTSSARLFLSNFLRRLIVWKMSPRWIGKPSPIQLLKAYPTDSPFGILSILKDKHLGPSNSDSEKFADKLSGIWVQRKLNRKGIVPTVEGVLETVRRNAWMSLYPEKKSPVRIFRLKKCWESESGFNKLLLKYCGKKLKVQGVSWFHGHYGTKFAKIYLLKFYIY